MKNLMDDQMTQEELNDFLNKSYLELDLFENDWKNDSEEDEDWEDEEDEEDEDD